MEQNLVLIVIKLSTGEELMGQVDEATLARLYEGYNPHKQGGDPIIHVTKPCLVMPLRFPDGTLGTKLAPFMFASPSAPLHQYHSKIGAFTDVIDPPEHTERYMNLMYPKVVEVATPEATKIILGQ